MSSENGSPSGNASSAAKVLILRSKDGEEFSVKESIAIQSITIKNLVDDDCASTTIPLPNVDSKTLVMVLEYLNNHADSSYSEKDHAEFDKKFVKEHKAELGYLVLAADYLNIKKLTDLICQAFADIINDMSVEEVRGFFNIVNDFSEEEEKQFREENKWAFE